MNKLKKVFEIIGDREWDWFGEKVLGIRPFDGSWLDAEIDIKGKSICVSIAELLSISSFCLAFWGDKYGYFSFDTYGGREWIDREFDYGVRRRWMVSSLEAFEILQQKGLDQALDYMIKTAKR